MKRIPLLWLAVLLSSAALPAQVFWAAGYTENLDTVVNGQILIQPLPDTVLIQGFDSPVQFESTMAGGFIEDVPPAFTLPLAKTLPGFGNLEG